MHGLYPTIRLDLTISMGFPGSSVVKASAHNAGDLGWEDPLRRKWQPTPQSMEIDIEVSDYSASVYHL